MAFPSESYVVSFSGKGKVFQYKKLIDKMCLDFFLQLLFETILNLRRFQWGALN